MTDLILGQETQINKPTHAEANFGAVSEKVNPYQNEPHKAEEAGVSKTRAPVPVVPQQNPMGVHAPTPSVPTPSNMVQRQFMQGTHARPSLFEVHAIMQNQHRMLTEQLIEFQRLVAVQRQLTGRVLEPPPNTVPNAAPPKTSQPVEAPQKVKDFVAFEKPVVPRSPLEQRLARLIDANGGITALDNIPKFIQLMLKEKTPEGQSLLLTVILSTVDSICLKKMLESDILNILTSWLTQAKQDGKVTHIRLILKVCYKKKLASSLSLCNGLAIHKKISDSRLELAFPFDSRKQSSLAQRSKAVEESAKEEVS